MLVTGASGFLGGQLARALCSAGHQPRALVRATSDRSGLDGVPCVVGELDAPASLTQVADGVDAVVHAAARVDDAGSRAAFMRTNVAGTQALLHHAQRAGVRRFVFISSPSVVMTGRDQVDIDESVPLPARFLHPYAESKALAELAVLGADSPGGMRTLALRPRGVWGRGDQSGPIPRLLERMSRGRLPNVSGGRRVLVDLCHVENAVHGCLRALEADAAGKAYFLTDGVPIEVWETARALATRFGLRPPGPGLPPRLVGLAARGLEAAFAPFPDRSPSLSRYGLALISKTHTYDIRAARRDLDYAPSITWEEGLADFAAWIASEGGIEEYLARVGSR